MKKTIEFDEECKSCDGTGIYVGMAERDGYGVVCYNCNGTGKFHFSHTYETFRGSKVKRDGIKKVVECNPGIVLGGNLDFGGITYQEWISGKKFEKGTEMRKYTCPAWWFQSSDCSKKPNWNECGVGGTFSSCKHFCEKDKCWGRYDLESEQ